MPQNRNKNCARWFFVKVRNAQAAGGAPSALDARVQGAEPERPGVARRRRGAAAPAAHGGLLVRVSGRLRPRRSASASWMCASGASSRAVDPDAPAGDHQTLEKASATWMQTTCTQVCSPTRPAHPLPACPVRKRERGQGLIGVVLRVWGWFLALAAPSRDPATDSTPCSLPCARSLDLASGPEALSRPCCGHSRGRAQRGIATDSGPTPLRQCRTTSARTAGAPFSADCSGGCGRVGSFWPGVGGWDGPFPMWWEAAGLLSWPSWPSRGPRFQLWDPAWHLF